MHRGKQGALHHNTGHTSCCTFFSRIRCMSGGQGPCRAETLVRQVKRQDVCMRAPFASASAKENCWSGRKVPALPCAPSEELRRLPAMGCPAAGKDATQRSVPGVSEAHSHACHIRFARRSTLLTLVPMACMHDVYGATHTLSLQAAPGAHLPGGWQHTSPGPGAAQLLQRQTPAAPLPTPA